MAVFTIAALFMVSKASTLAYGASSNHKLVFGIDGLAYGSFQLARSRGMFPSFTNSGRHIAPYPSMTEPSWTEIMGGKTLFPMSGNIRTVEGDYFDIESMTSHVDPRNEFTREAGPYNFYRAFDYYFNPFLETLMYFPNESTNQLEIDQLEPAVFSGFTDDHFIAYISAVDATAHTQKDQLYPLLQKISDKIEAILIEEKQKYPDLQAWIVSDHGNVGSFAEGLAESYLTPVTLTNAAKRAGLEFSDKKLTKPNQIAMPIMALGNLGNVYFKDLSHRRDFALQAIQEPFVDLITYQEVTSTERFVTIIGTGASEARLYWGPKGYAYLAIQGNPLGLDASLVSGSAGAGLHWISDKELFAALEDSTYPDAAYRLTQNAKKQVENEADLEVNLKEAYCFDGSFSQYVKMVRTHGALSAKSSLGTVASTNVTVPHSVRSKDIMTLIGITPAEAFHQISDTFHQEGKTALSNSLSLKGISTRVMELSNDLIFRRLSKISNLTMDLFPSEQMSAISDSFRKYFAAATPNSKSDIIMNAVKGVDQTSLLNNLDKVYALKGLLASKQDPQSILTQVKTNVLSIPGLGSLSAIDQMASNSSPSGPELSQALNLFRESVMKLYTVPFFIDQALNIPEFDTVPDPRDLNFASQWITQIKPAIQKDPGTMLDQSDTYKRLFNQIFTERKLREELYPASFPLLYNPVPKDVTVVYVPGIYNELFDTEIFAKGLRGLGLDLGLRVLYVDVDGRCSSEHNSKMIYDQLQEDTRKRVARGYSTPKYLILGYSKGGVDSTEALLLDPKFTRSQILGLVSIASPNHGTSIVDNADLPAFISGQAVARAIPPECVEDSGSKSLLKGARQAFWDKNLTALSGLTRFYSMSFEISLEDAHPWMKITKNIARFQSPNDGVVTVESSKFPPALGAVDLGTIHADHLAGIAASQFPQAAFLESILLTLFETSSMEKAPTLAWYEDLSKQSPGLIQDYSKRQLAAEVLKSITASHQSPILVEGPLPNETPQGTDSPNDEWYAVISQQESLLGDKAQCKPGSDYSAFAKTLRKDLDTSSLALKPFTLTCNASGTLSLSIETDKNAWYQLWKSPTFKQTAVANLDDLVTQLLTSALVSGKNPLEVPVTLPADLPKSSRTPFALPQSNLVWNVDERIDLKSLSSRLEAFTIEPATPAAYPNGLQIIFDHQSVKDFRKEYLFSYETTSPGNEDDNPNIYLPVLDPQTPNPAVALRLRSNDNSTRMTSPAFRFKPVDFKNIHISLKIGHGPAGADSAKGGNAKDDAPFKLWFTLRTLSQGEDRSKFNPKENAKIFGYYWAENPKITPGQLIENYYSNKNYIIATLPESWEIALGSGAADPTSEGKWLDINRDLAADIHRAYPALDINNIEVVGLTFQSDSNETHEDTESFFKEVEFKP